ncbi:hypothetical protein OB2597_13038 [Pseudooceanicola batsensis HTCC2597]|uniref:Polysaccharide biosynthesis protein n=1 Tax=Pseudooceanicola batsensis (strain ATCC BAA-863 / DSM 15984 / KCTC 12145 / HTCC2597) TaxID=252305 RepID=A3TY36_PSEBH|nr:hypothetical protein [Pseudooceanicola batsensis]EAQ03070.1 hypothetical protein OB2597_13038 [Pseudooceanicola batsensis HTCC2597]
MSLLNRSSAIGLAMLLRAGLMLVISAMAYRTQAPEDAAAFFQCIYLQAIAIAFLSASGFFRVQSKRSEDEVSSYLSAMTLLVLPSVALPLSVALLVDEYAARLPELLIAWVGAVATAYAAPISAIVMKSRGPFAAFLPACAAAVLALLTLLLVGDAGAGRLTPYLALSGFQVTNILLLLASDRKAVRTRLPGLSRLRAGLPWDNIREAFVVGACNVLNMLLVFAIREAWAERAGADIAAAVFLTLRISDSAMQLFHMVLSGHPVITRLIAGRWSLRAQVAMTALSVGALLLLGMNAAALGAIAFAVAAQIALDVSRYPWSTGFLYQMAHFDLRNYVIFVVLQPVIALLLAFVPMARGAPEGLMIFMAISVSIGAVISTLQARRAAR